MHSLLLNYDSMRIKLHRCLISFDYLSRERYNEPIMLYVSFPIDQFGSTQIWLKDRNRMSEMSRVSTDPNILFHSYATEPTGPGGMDIDVVIDTPPVEVPAPSATMVSVPAAAQQKATRTATVEHLA